MAKVYILGMGPGSPDYFLPVSLKIIKECDILIGGQRNLTPFLASGQEIIFLNADLLGVITKVKESYQQKKIAFLLSGDTGFYSMLTFLKKYFTSEELEVIPGISSFQYLLAKLKETWHDAYLGSLHGRQFDLLKAVKEHGKVVVLTDGENTPQKIAEILEANGFSRKKVIVGENLSYPEERITIGSPAEISLIKDFALSVVVILDA